MSKANAFDRMVTIVPNTSFLIIVTMNVTAKKFVLKVIVNLQYTKTLLIQQKENYIVSFEERITRLWN